MKKVILFLISTLCFIVLLRTFVVSSLVIHGQSMTPYLHDGDRVIVNIAGDLLYPAKPGDMIYFKLNDKEQMVKRVIATPGDYIALHKKSVYVNGNKMTEPGDYNDLLKIAGMQSQIVPEKCYIVLGDNEKESVDSRVFGCVDESNIIGTVYKYWTRAK